MAERPLSGNDLLLYRGNGAGPEVFELIACLLSNDINQALAVIQQETKCGVIKLPGTEDASVDFEMQAILDPDAARIGLEQMQADFKGKLFRNYRITTAAEADGDPRFDFRAFISELNVPSPTNDFVTVSGSLQVDKDGIALTIIE